MLPESTQKNIRDNMAKIAELLINKEVIPMVVLGADSNTGQCSWAEVFDLNDNDAMCNSLIIGAAMDIRDGIVLEVPLNEEG